MTIISALKASLSKRAYFLGRPQPKATEDLEAGNLEAQSSKVVHKDDTVRRWPAWCTKKFCYYFVLAFVAFLLILFAGLLLEEVIPYVPDARTKKFVASLAAQKAWDGYEVPGQHLD